MRHSVIPGILFILSGLLLAGMPQFFPSVCDRMVATASGGSVPMKCFWMARAELGTGALVFFSGLLYCVCHDAGVRFGITAMTMGTALLAIALPTVLIGVCPSETMDCHMGTRPALILAGTAVFFVALIACLGLSRAMKENKTR